jgi:hypothetical protein
MGGVKYERVHDLANKDQKLAASYKFARNITADFKPLFRACVVCGRRKLLFYLFLVLGTGRGNTLKLSLVVLETTGE